MYIDRLREHYARASPEQRRRGREWYPTVTGLLHALAEEVELTAETVAGVMAVTSPDAQLKTNLDWTRRALRGDTRVGRYPNNVEPKVRAILAGQAPDEVCSGPKVAAFYRACLGDEDALVLDRWALRAATGEPGIPGVRVRREIEAAYQQLAEEVGETPAALQAIIWIQIRESTPRPDGVIPKLDDINDLAWKWRQGELL